MFSRGVLRVGGVAGRAVAAARPTAFVQRPSALKVAITAFPKQAAITPYYMITASFNTTTKKCDPETVQETQVPVVSYQGGERITEELKVGQTSTGPVTPAGVDVERVAVPLSPSAYRHLTPTLAKFTCADKVVMVTG